MRFEAVLSPPLLLLLCPLASWSFVLHKSVTSTTTTATSSMDSRRFMGLYDKPLPPRPPPREPEKNDENDNDDDIVDFDQRQRMFNFDSNGVETQNLLPRLSRTLESGIDCYFETSDRLVQNLVEKTECHPEDAAWALEACKGDITEAWTCISTARRQMLSTKEEDYRPSLQEQFEARLQRDKQKKEQKKWGKFAPGTPDEQWLPVENPKPVDDEPWFTG